MNDIFAATTAQPVTPNGNQPVATDPVAELVGEGKRYATAEALAKGKLEADAFIEQLKKENAGLREDLASRLTAEERAAAVLAAASQPSDQGTPATKVTPVTVVQPAAVEELVNKALSAHDLKKEREANVKQSNDEMVKKFGTVEKAKEVMLARAAELNMTPEALVQLAARTPAAFLKLMGVDEPITSGPAPTRGSVNTQALGVTQGNSSPAPDTFAYFETLRRTKPQEYWKPETQNRMFALAKEKGSAFYQR